MAELVPTVVVPVKVNGISTTTLVDKYWITCDHHLTGVFDVGARSGQKRRQDSHRIAGHLRQDLQSFVTLKRYGVCQWTSWPRSV